jgi:hypothetical protein
MRNSSRTSFDCFKNDFAAARQNSRHITHELKRIAKPLLGMQEVGFAGKGLLSQP